MFLRNTGSAQADGAENLSCPKLRRKVIFTKLMSKVSSLINERAAQQSVHWTWLCLRLPASLSGKQSFKSLVCGFHRQASNASPFGGAQGCSERTPSLAAEMGEVETTRLRLTERNKVLQMDAVKVSGDVRFNWTCPECNNLNDIGLRAFVYAINRHFGIVCSACERSFRPYLDSPDRAAELPLEPTAPTTAADNYRSDEDIPGVVDDISELWS